MKQLSPKDFLSELRLLLIKDKKEISELEYTFGNYDSGKEIKEGIPTLTTDFCEIGFHNKKIYFVIILESASFSEIFFKRIKSVENLRIYGFRNFKETFYPKINQYDLLSSKIKEEKYFQIQIDLVPANPEEVHKRYTELEKIFQNNVEIINQLTVNLKQS